MGILLTRILFITPILIIFIRILYLYIKDFLKKEDNMFNKIFMSYIYFWIIVIGTLNFYEYEQILHSNKIFFMSKENFVSLLCLITPMILIGINIIKQKVKKK